MNKRFLLRELKLVLRNKLVILYSAFGLLFLVSIMFLLLSNVESQNFNSFVIVSLIGYSSFWGSGFFVWDWDREYYKFFIISNGLKKLILSKIIFIYISNLLITISALSIFKTNGYDYYFKVLLYSGLNGIGAIVLIILIILSLNKEKIDLFDNKVFIVKQSAINILATLILVGFIALSYYVFEMLSYQYLIVITLTINASLLIIFKNKVVIFIKKKLRKSNEIK